MLQARYRKALWIFALVWLIFFHGWLVYLLGVCPFRDGGPLLQENVFRLAAIIWALGTAAMALGQFASYQRFRRRALEGMVPVEESWIRSVCIQAAKEAGCGTVTSLYRSRAVSTPLVLGFAVPVMLIPQRKDYSWAELRMVFLHECTHVKKKDLWYKLIFTVGICLLWFQPLAYLLKAAAFCDVEVACDQSVVEGKAEADRKAYADFLLNSLRKGRDRELPYSAYFYNSKAVMKARLSVVEDMRERSGLPGTVVCVLVAAVTIIPALYFAGAAGLELEESYGTEGQEAENFEGLGREKTGNLAGQEAQEPADQALPQLPVCRARTRAGVTEVTWDAGKVWSEVPVEQEDLLARGDQMDGALMSVQEKSYVVSNEITAFAYGGSSEVPVTVLWSKDQGEAWVTSVVTYEYRDVRRLFLSFPDAEHGFLVLTTGRTMWQEGDVLYRTEDGGMTWVKTERESSPGMEGYHSLTTGAEFLTPEVGFISIRGSEEPVLYRTEDGGVNWELYSFPEPEAGQRETWSCMGEAKE